MSSFDDEAEYDYDNKTQWFSVRCVKEYNSNSSNAQQTGNPSSSSNRTPSISSSSNIGTKPSSSGNGGAKGNYCYGYLSYRDCNLIGGKWITDEQHCLSGGGNIVNTDYCNRNGINIDDTPSDRQSSSSYGSGGGYTGSYGSFTYQGKTYNTVIIGTQTWMAENLNYNASGSVCYDNSESNCNKYGRLYNWATAMALPSSCNSSTCSGQINAKHRGICPSGWHIPSNDEWKTLINYAGEYSDNGKKLKATSGWNSNDNGTDDYGFSALPGGKGYIDGSFNYVGDRGYWWSASECGNNCAYGSENKSLLYSVRCVMD